MGIYGEGIATWDLKVVFDVDSLPLMAMRSLKLLLPLFNAMLSSSSSKSSGRAIIKYGFEYRNFCLIHPRRPKCKSEELLDFSLPKNETCLSPPLVINEMRQPPLRVLLQRQKELVEVEVQLVEGSVVLAAELGEDPSEPKIMAWKRQSKPILNSRLLSLGLRLEKYGAEARSPRLEELLAIVRPHSQISLISRGS